MMRLTNLMMILLFVISILVFGSMVQAGPASQAPELGIQTPAGDQELIVKDKEGEEDDDEESDD